MAEYIDNSNIELELEKVENRINGLMNDVAFRHVVNTVNKNIIERFKAEEGGEKEVFKHKIASDVLEEIVVELDALYDDYLSKVDKK